MPDINDMSCQAAANPKNGRVPPPEPARICANTLAELVAALSKFPQDAKWFVWEDGFIYVNMDWNKPILAEIYTDNQ